MQGSVADHPLVAFLCHQGHARCSLSVQRPHNSFDGVKHGIGICFLYRPGGIKIVVVNDNFGNSQGHDRRRWYLRAVQVDLFDDKITCQPLGLLSEVLCELKHMTKQFLSWQGG